MTARSPEIELILCCARAHLDSDTIKRIHTLVQKELHWDAILQTALQHRVMPLLYQNLCKICPEAVPHNTLERLRTYFLTNTGRNLAFAATLLKLIKLFNKNGITVVPFKGPVLAESVYGSLAFRQFSDLDILIHREDALDAYQLLLSHAYCPEVRLDMEQIKAYSKTEYSLALYHKDLKVVVELHWEVTGRYTGYPFDLDHFDHRLETTTISGKEVVLFPAEDLLVYLCIHGSKDGWCNLDHICCVAELARARKDMDWDRVIDRAEQMRCRKMLFVGLQLAHDMLEAPINRQVLNIIKSDSAAIGIVSRIKRTLFNSLLTPQERKIPSNFSLCHFRIRESFSGQVRYLLNLLFVPSRRDWGLFTLPASMAFLYYPLRPLRLAGEMVLLLFRNMMSESPAPEIRQVS